MTNVMFLKISTLNTDSYLHQIDCYDKKINDELKSIYSLFKLLTKMFPKRSVTKFHF